jgi:hypothetical protein
VRRTFFEPTRTLGSVPSTSPFLVGHRIAVLVDARANVSSPSKAAVLERHVGGAQVEGQRERRGRATS